jgi:hypothetical protein
LFSIVIAKDTWTVKSIQTTVSGGAPEAAAHAGLRGRHCGPILEALPDLGIDVASIGIFHGAEGVTILDPKPHGPSR